MISIVSLAAMGSALVAGAKVAEKVQARQASTRAWLGEGEAAARPSNAPRPRRVSIGGHPNPHLSDKVRPLDLTDQQQADLVAFMKALTGPLPKVETGRRPE